MLVWRKTTLFLRRYETSYRVWEKGEVGLEVCPPSKAFCYLKQKVVRKETSHLLEELRGGL